MLYIIDGKYHGGVNVGEKVVSENFRVLSDIHAWAVDYEVSGLDYQAVWLFL